MSKQFYRYFSKISYIQQDAVQSVEDMNQSLVSRLETYYYLSQFLIKRSNHVYLNLTGYFHLKKLDKHCVNSFSPFLAKLLLSFIISKHMKRSPNRDHFWIWHLRMYFVDLLLMKNKNCSMPDSKL